MLRSVIPPYSVIWETNGSYSWANNDTPAVAAVLIVQMICGQMIKTGPIIALYSYLLSLGQETWIRQNRILPWWIFCWCWWKRTSHWIETKRTWLQGCSGPGSLSRKEVWRNEGGTLREKVRSFKGGSMLHNFLILIYKHNKLFCF